MPTAQIVEYVSCWAQLTWLVVIVVSVAVLRAMVSMVVWVMVVVVALFAPTNGRARRGLEVLRCLSRRDKS